MPKRLHLRRFRRGEKQTLTVKLHDRKLPTWAMHRYQIVAQVRGGWSVFQTARQVRCAANTAYLWVMRFNQSGFRAFERSSHPEGRPSELTPTQLNLLYHIAQKRPTDVGLPFTHWSMTKLQDYLVKKRHFPKVSAEWLRQLLHRAKVSWQRTKTWKQSHDPKFKSKKSVFWHFMLSVPSAVSWSVMINWDRLNCVPSPVGVGPATATHNGIGRPTHGNAALSSCMVSTMCMPTVWLDVCGSEKQQRTSWPVSSDCENAIRSNFAYMW